MIRQNRRERKDKFAQVLEMLREYDDELLITQRHHRRPRSLGGSNDPANIYYLPIASHKSWHVLVGNMNAMQACKTINSFPWVKSEGVYLKCRFINGNACRKRGRHNSKNLRLCQQAWDQLFKGLDFVQSVSYMNSALIDSSYHFYIRKKRRR